MEDYKRYMFVREYVDNMGEGTIPYGSEITVMGNKVYFNGGIVGPVYRDLLLHIVYDEQLKNRYLREMVIPYNKV